MRIHIQPMNAGDWPEVAAIYREGIATGNATFATAPPASWEAWNVARVPGCSLVARETVSGAVVGWAALSPTSSREVYAGVVDVSLYVGAAHRRKGIGSQLMAELIVTSESRGIWTLQAGIFPENKASLALHARHGFRRVGVRERVGYMTFGPYAGRWRDVVLMERRSKVIGGDPA